MYINKKETDSFSSMFSRLPEKELPGNFREKMMHKVMQEAILMKKREERLGLLITIGLGLLILGIGIVALVLLEIPKVEIRMPDLTVVPFYIYIGGLVFLLLTADYKLRKRFREKHSK